ncbi:hypothetical protein AB0D94_16735 [Streptomyces sp. NPDC048255]|uniref:hypothetical protein n=1 Tax=Streptomyces sp. NPDC048255 TaxID=3154713 RepID=UPI003407267B
MPVLPFRLLLAFLAGTALVLAGPGAAHASQTVEIPAAAPGGISASVQFYGAVVPQPYDPDPEAYFGDRKCLQIYHDYTPTPGCGGFQLRVTLHDVRSSPGFQAGLWSSDPNFQAHADTARTFRCVRPDGGSDRSHDVVVRTQQTRFSPTYFYTDANYVISSHRSDTADHGPHFYINFPASDISCPAGTTASQYGLKVTDLRISINDTNVFGTTTWAHPGPFYA